VTASSVPNIYYNVYLNAPSTEPAKPINQETKPAAAQPAPVVTPVPAYPSQVPAFYYPPQMIPVQAAPAASSPAPIIITSPPASVNQEQPVQAAKQEPAAADTAGNFNINIKMVGNPQGYSAIQEIAPVSSVSAAPAVVSQTPSSVPGMAAPVSGPAVVSAPAVAPASAKGTYQPVQEAQPAAQAPVQKTPSITINQVFQTKPDGTVSATTSSSDADVKINQTGNTVAPIAQELQPATAVKISARTPLKLPDPNNGKYYRVQVGAYSTMAKTNSVVNQIKNIGYNAFYQPNGCLFRVVLTNVPSWKLSDVANDLRNGGFEDLWSTEE
jgi:hypothetical protein